MALFPGGVDSLSYDSGGRLSSLESQRGSAGSTPAPTYVGQNRVSADNGTMSATYDYDGFGHLVGSEVEQLQGPPTRQYFERDAFGNATVEQTWDPMGEQEVPGSKWNFEHTPNKGGRRWLGTEEWDFGTVPEPDGWVAGESERIYDARGNQVSAYEKRFTWDYSDTYETADTVTLYRSYAESYWDAAGFLRAHQINRDSTDYVGLVEAGDPWDLTPSSPRLPRPKSVDNPQSLCRLAPGSGRTVPPKNALALDLRCYI